MPPATNPPGPLPTGGPTPPATNPPGPLPTGRPTPPATNPPAPLPTGGPKPPATNPPAPLPTGGRAVPADWIDYNGHMMDGYYCVAFTEATDALLDHLGLGAAYREQTGSSIYTVESHLCFFRSARAGVNLRFASQLLGVDAKRLHAFHRMTDAATGDELAANELMLLHVDIATERVTPMPPQRREAAAALAAEHAALPVPPTAGRCITMTRR
jgi:acyl-CoA thioester hydrolase